MKYFLLSMLTALSIQVYASCESQIIEGKHTALELSVAQDAALEDAVELCYPGKAEISSLSCEEIDGSYFDHEKSLTSCRQEVVCTLCGADLARQHEALD